MGADVGVLVGEEGGEADRDGGSGVVGAGLEGDAPDNDVFADQFAATERIDVALDLAEAEAVAFQHGFEEGGGGVVHLGDFDEGTKVLFETGSAETRARLGIRGADTGV